MALGNGERARGVKSVKQVLKERMHDPVPRTGEWLGRVLNGFYQHHAVPGNWASLDRYRERVSRYWRQVLERRSQRAPVDSGPGDSLFQRWLPRPRLVHPYPAVRFDANHPR